MKVKFVPQDVEFEIKPGQTVMDLAHEKGIPIHSTCNGMPSCAECRVRVTDGDWNVNPPSRKELSLIGTGYYIDQRRLSCQMLCFGDVTVDTSEQIAKGTEGPVTKKFLTKVHKESAEKSHSLGGVMLTDSADLIKDLQDNIPDAPAPLTQAGLTERGPREGRGGGGGRGGRDRGRGGGSREPNAQARVPTAGSGGNGGERPSGGRRRRRGGRGRSGGGGGNRGGGTGGSGGGASL
jgi:ferredoxin, 2Fe-2S